MAEALRVLIVEDSQIDTSLIVHELRRGGFQVTFEQVETAAAMQAALEASPWDLIVSDYSLPQFSGEAALLLCQKLGLDIPFIVVSGMIGEDRAVEMLKAGAHNCVMKPHLDRLAPAVREELRATQERRLRRQTEANAAYLASLVESCDDAIIAIDPGGTVVSWNAGAERLHGYSAAEIVGRSLSILLPQYRPEALAELLGKIEKGEQVERYETVRLRKDGTPVEVSMTISPIKDAHGRIIGASTVAHDITQRKLEETERFTLIQDLSAALGRKVGESVRTDKQP